MIGFGDVGDSTRLPVIPAKAEVLFNSESWSTQ